MTSSENNIIAGLQWGGEGKKRLTDFFADRAEVIVRFNGSSAGGHPITAAGERYSLDFLPCGIHHDGKLCVITKGVLLDLEKLSREISTLKAAGVMKAKLRISPGCPMIFDFHKRLDVLESRASGICSYDDDQPGCGAALSDELKGLSVRSGDLLDVTAFHEKLERSLSIKNEILTKLYGERAVDVKTAIEKAEREAAQLRPYIAPVEGLVREAVESNAGTLFEGCGGAMNDRCFGRYPFISPARTSAQSLFLSVGIKHNSSIRVIGAVKAYCTMDGRAPFVTEETGAIAAFIRSRGAEYSETAGRPRRVGWLDLPALKFAAESSGVDVLALTKLDVLTGIDELLVCTSYIIDGEERRGGEMTAAEAERAKPVYTVLEGWHEELPGYTDFNRLPIQTRNYIQTIEDFTGLRVIWAGLGRQWGNALFDPGTR